MKRRESKKSSISGTWFRRFRRRSMKGRVFRPRCSTLSRVRRHELLKHDPKPFFLGMSRLIVIASIAAGARGLIVEGNLSAAQPRGIKRSSVHKRDGRFVDWKITDSSSTKAVSFSAARAQRNAFRRPDMRLAKWTFDRGRMPAFGPLLPLNLPGHHGSSVRGS